MPPRKKDVLPGLPAPPSARCSDVPYGGTRRPAPADSAGATRMILPPNPSGPTFVSVGFQVRELRGINPVESEFGLRGYFRVSWCDPRLGFDPAAEGSDGQPDDFLIEADAMRLDQVFSNLVANALRYTPAGGRIVLTFRLSDTDDDPGRLRTLVLDEAVVPAID